MIRILAPPIAPRTMLSTYAAVDIGALLPIIPLDNSKLERYSDKLRKLAPAIRAAFFFGLLASILIGLPYVGLACAAAGAVMWAAFRPFSHRWAWASPSAYVFASAVHHTKVRWALRLANAVTAVLLFLVTVAATLHSAWGCYGPGSPPKAWTYGMCGYGFPHRNNPPAPVCAELSLGPSCNQENDYWPAYGTLISAATHIQSVAAPVIVLATIQGYSRQN